MAIGFGAKENLIRTLVGTMRGKLAVDKVNCHLEGIAPKILWNRRVGEKSKGFLVRELKGLLVFVERIVFRSSFFFI